MSLLLFLLSLIPLVGVNILHGYLLWQRSNDGRPHTISEHAAERPQLLLRYRIVHCLSGMSMVVLAVLYLLPNKQSLMALILAVGGILEVIEAAVLHKKADGHPFSMSSHEITAWFMALCYFIYGIFIANYSALNPFITNSIWVLFILMLIYSIYKKFQNFWIVQMIYFVFLGSVILVAHIHLLA